MGLLRDALNRRDQQRQQAQKQADETQTLAGQNKALETVLRTYGQNLGVTADDIDAYTAQSPDQSPRQRNAALNQLLQGAVAMTQQRDQQQAAARANAELALRQQQDARAAQSAALANQVTANQIDQYTRDQAATARANQSADDIITAYRQMGLPSGNGAGVYAPQFQDEVARRINSLPVQYRAQGGDLTPQTSLALQQLAARAGATNQQFRPEIIDLPTGDKAMTTSFKSAQLMPKKPTLITSAPQVHTAPDGSRFWQDPLTGKVSLIHDPAEKPIDTIHRDQYTSRLTDSINTVNEKLAQGRPKFFGVSTYDNALFKAKQDANHYSRLLGGAILYPDADVESSLATPTAQPASPPPAISSPQHAATVKPATPPATEKTYTILNNRIYPAKGVTLLDAMQAAIDNGDVTHDDALRYLQAAGYKLK